MKHAPILFVDDSAVARAATARLLDQQGVAATVLGSSLETAGVDAHSFSAALLDIELGDGLGTEVAERLRCTSPSLPIAFLTGGAHAAELARAARLGPVFHKPAGMEAAVRWVVEASRVPGDEA
ncbi:MAG: response regulator [Byssovorax sp.]